MLLDTGANSTVISNDFVQAHKLLLATPSHKHICVANRARAPVLGNVSPFSVKLGDIHTTFCGLVLIKLSHIIIASMDWLRANCLVIDWDSSVITL